MALILKTLWGIYKTGMEEWRDRRIDGYVFMDNPIYIILVLAGYLYFVLDFGPKWMKNRPAFNIDKLLIFYNAIQVVYCAYIVLVGTIVILPIFNLKCEPIDYSDNYYSVLILKVCYLYFILKVIDLLDTVFFILRKKSVQVTFLHVYHHAGMVALSWGGTRFVGGGSGVFLGYLNSIVHMFMYAYYLLTVYNKSFKESVWWKRHITHLQLIQFGFLLILFVGILLQPNCAYPKWVTMLLIPQNLFMFSLFGDFYYRTYIKAKKKKVEEIKKD
nr:elongation of very long chain fatty acids protein 7-like [Onthophagus taurus]